MLLTSRLRPTERLRHAPMRSVLGMAVVIGVASLTPWPARAQPTLADLATRGRDSGQTRIADDLAARARTRLAELRAEATSLATAERTLLGEARRLEIEAQIRAAEVERVEAELSGVLARIETAEARVAEAAEQVAREAPEIAARLRRVHRLHAPLDLWWIAGSEDLRQGRARWRLLSGVLARDRARIEQYRLVMAVLDTERRDLRARQGELEALRAEAAAERAALDRATRERAALARRLAEQRDLAEALAGELAEAEARLDDSIARLADLSREVEAPLPIRAFRGRLDWPLRGRLSSRFGPQTATRFGTRTYRNGIEIDADEATPVRAIHEGRVVFAAPFEGFGRLVIVDHGDGAFSLYGHLSSMLAPVGTAVTAGSILGTVGRTPDDRAALYLEMRIDGRPVDPVEWLLRANY